MPETDATWDPYSISQMSQRIQLKALNMKTSLSFPMVPSKLGSEKGNLFTKYDFDLAPFSHFRP
jgi:hypothetical protein